MIPIRCRTCSSFLCRNSYAVDAVTALPLSLTATALPPNLLVIVLSVTSFFGAPKPAVPEMRNDKSKNEKDAGQMHAAAR
jgi:hypothetical protein